MEYVVLVHSDDTLIGVEEKLLAHQKGSLHRAVSVCLFDVEGRWLLQRRAASKYHAPGQWANSCCSHPRLNETPLQAATRRVKEELGADVSLTSRGSFIYKEPVGQGLIEHELDYVFTGVCSKEMLKPNPDEVCEVQFLSQDEIANQLAHHPELFAPWFQHVFQQIKSQKELDSMC